MQIHSMEAQHAAIGEVASNGNLHKTIRQAKKDPWVVKGSLDDVGEAGVPQVFHNMIWWMLKGVHSVKTKPRMRALHRAVSFVSQQIMKTHRSDRQVLFVPKSVDVPDFRSTVETPLMLGMSQYRDHWRSHKLAEVLSKSGVCNPYNESNNA